MPEAAYEAIQAKVRGQLDRLPARTFDISRHVQAVLSALDASDPAVVESRLQTAYEACRDLVHEAIEKRLGAAIAAKEAWEIIWNAVRSFPREDFDDIGKEIESAFNGQLTTLITLRDGPVRMLAEQGYQVENAGQLRRDIEDLQTLKEGIFENWPWSNRLLPPPDRDMVARSRAAFAQGEGEPIEHLIRRLGGEAAQAG